MGSAGLPAGCAEDLPVLGNLAKPRIPPIRALCQKCVLESAFYPRPERPRAHWLTQANENSRQPITQEPSPEGEHENSPGWTRASRRGNPGSTSPDGLS